MHTVYCHTHGSITSSNARLGEATKKLDPRDFSPKVKMRDRVIFEPAENHLFDPNHTASRAQGLNSLLSYALTLYYLAL